MEGDEHWWCRPCIWVGRGWFESMEVNSFKPKTSSYPNGIVATSLLIFNIKTNSVLNILILLYAHTIELAHKQRLFFELFYCLLWKWCFVHYLFLYHFIEYDLFEHSVQANYIVFGLCLSDYIKDID